MLLATNSSWFSYPSKCQFTGKCLFWSRKSIMRFRPNYGGHEFTSMSGNSGDSGGRNSSPKLPKPRLRICISGEKETRETQNTWAGRIRIHHITSQKGLFWRCFCASKIHCREIVQRRACVVASLLSSAIDLHNLAAVNKRVCVISSTLLVYLRFARKGGRGSWVRQELLSLFCPGSPLPFL